MRARSRMKPVVAIDGPAGAGKSTVTRRVTEELGYTRVDTGALYRAVAWFAAERGVAWEDADRVSDLAEELAQPGATSLSTEGATATILILGQDVSEAIRTQEVATGASIVSAHPGVRAALLGLQRELGRRGGVVLEGRDIGSVVFPDAELKFFLTASVEVRAERRRRELLGRGEAAEFDVIRREVVERDHKDTVRPIAPLTQAPDAIVVDSSTMTLAEVVAFMVARVRQKEASMQAASDTE